MQFYDPDAVEHDLEIISKLMNGKRQLTNQSAQKIYYRIKSDNITFFSDTGSDFMDRLKNSMTDSQIESIDKEIAYKKNKLRNMKRNGKRIIMINGKICAVMTCIVVVFLVIAYNWEELAKQDPVGKIAEGTKQTIDHINEVKSFSDQALEEYNANEEARKAAETEVVEESTQEPIILRESEVDEPEREIQDYDDNGISDIDDFELSEDGTILYKYTGNSVLVDIPNSVTTIEKDAFDNLESVRGIMLPLSIKKVKKGAFSGLQVGMIIYVYDAGTTNTITVAKEIAKEYEQLVYSEHLNVEDVEKIAGINYGID